MITEKRPIIETDEVRSSAGSEEHKVRIWLAAERYTRQIVGVAFGDRSDETCPGLWQSLPSDYRKHAVIYTDFRQSYGNVLPSERLRQVGKDSGQTSHIERFNNTLRRRCPGMVRKTLSFSRDPEMHRKRVEIFTDCYNTGLSV